MNPYVLEQSGELEAARLRHLEEVLDPITTEHLWTLGVRPGWRCLVVGAGGGSIAAWLAERVGESGEVVTVDLDLTLFERHGRRDLETMRLGVLEDALAQGEFNLVHARMVVSHLGARRLEAIRRMANALKPGGYLMIEENDLLWNQAEEWPASDPAAGRLLHKLWIGLAKVFERSQHDVNWGRWVAPTLRQVGTVEIRGEGRCFIGASSAGRELLRLTALRFREPLLQMGAVTEAEFDLLNDGLSEPRGEGVALGAMFVSAWGRRPSE